jgi:hypothetical protein
MKTGIEIIAEERQRQITVEGWTAEHDSQHTRGELAFAAKSYAEHAACQSAAKEQFAGVQTDYHPQWWPWDMKWWKPSTDPIRNLAKAGALIAAEIDRLQRLNNG